MRRVYIAGWVVILFLTLACDGAGGDAVLGTNESGALMAQFGLNGEIPVQSGLALGADPDEVRLDPCDPDAPVDSETGKLLGKSTIGASVRDVDQQPMVGVEVFFSTSAGVLESMGAPVLTDDQGLATDTLAVDEEDAGEVVVTVSASEFVEMITVPVILVPKPPITLEMDPVELWPPNHKMREVTAVFGGLDCEPTATFELVSVTSNEPDNGQGDGSTVDDIQGVDVGTADTEFLLRAERTGGGDGRVYTVTYELTDGEGVSSTMSATVIVPHDQGN